MRLAAFNGSSRKNGNTRILLEIICDETRRAGIDSEIISLSDFSLRGCLGCFCQAGRGMAQRLVGLFHLGGNIVDGPVQLFHHAFNLARCADHAVAFGLFRLQGAGTLHNH